MRNEFSVNAVEEIVFLVHDLLGHHLYCLLSD